MDNLFDKPVNLIGIRDPYKLLSLLNKDIGYTLYKGMWWKLIMNKGRPVWRISEKEDDSMCTVWMWNARTYSLDSAYVEIRKEIGYPLESYSFIVIDYGK